MRLFSWGGSSALLLSLVTAPSAHAQDWVRTGTNLGAQRIRIAAANFKPGSADSETGSLKQVFDQTLFTDLQNAGIFDMVSKSMAPPLTPGSQGEAQLATWAAAPANAEMLAFGTLTVNGGQLAVTGFLDDTKNTQSPQVLGKQYSEAASTQSARHIAHRFADEIIERLGGLPGIAETTIYYVSAHSGTKEIMAMDYDGQSPRAVTHLGTISLSPHISPDNARVAFSSLGKQGWSIRMYSLELNRPVNFNSPAGTTLSPAWSSNGAQVAFSSDRPAGDSEIYVSDAAGNGVRRLTSFHGPDVSPCWNPKTNAQIAWVSGRTGLPQIYTMDSDGANVMRMTDGGYATSPSWSPNGQFLAYAWNRKYGPGAPGGQDIYIMDVASRRWIQLTHDAGRNDFPTWSPDGRHIAFQREGEGGLQIWTMLADGSEQQPLTHGGSFSQPNWSLK
ncbi:Tol-Pal system beta propeller repeat protein TolB [Acidipila sp. EB88]|nr:Tol-Pal system beta propeller repeat protein TolB [Acidipila sp. EB88]RRA50236.1 Tol-Pal system beta propeller repeat protein TolB [Acidipila sp. EB88]